jgi:hypothetical protein
MVVMVATQEATDVCCITFCATHVVAVFNVPVSFSHLIEIDVKSHHVFHVTDGVVIETDVQLQTTTSHVSLTRTFLKVVPTALSGVADVIFSVTSHDLSAVSDFNLSCDNLNFWLIVFIY